MSRYISKSVNVGMGEGEVTVPFYTFENYEESFSNEEIELRCDALRIELMAKQNPLALAISEEGYVTSMEDGLLSKIGAFLKKIIEMIVGYLRRVFGMIKQLKNRIQRLSSNKAIHYTYQMTNFQWFGTNPPKPEITIFDLLDDWRGGLVALIPVRVHLEDVLKDSITALKRYSSDSELKTNINSKVWEFIAEDRDRHETIIESAKLSETIQIDTKTLTGPITLHCGEGLDNIKGVLLDIITEVEYSQKKIDTFTNSLKQAKKESEQIVNILTRDLTDLNERKEIDERLYLFEYRLKYVTLTNADYFTIMNNVLSTFNRVLQSVENAANYDTKPVKGTDGVLYQEMQMPKHKKD